MINAIESAIDGLVNQIPGGQAVQQDIKVAFVNLLDRVVRERAERGGHDARHLFHRDGDAAAARIDPM